MNTKKQDILWRSLPEPGLEHLHLSASENGIAADGLIITSQDDRPIRLQYQIEMQKDWRVSLVTVQAWTPDLRTLILKSDGKGNWSDPNGLIISNLKGCVDVDITITPFTNTLPIRRLQLQAGQSEEIQVAYITAPELEISNTRQRYTFLDQTAKGAMYRFEGLDTGFQADLTIDEMGLVIDYPNLWTRVFEDYSGSRRRLIMPR
jgi:hypothetical protein